MGIKEEDFVETLFTASTHDSLLFLPMRARSTGSRCTKYPKRAGPPKARPGQFVGPSKDEKVTATLPVKEYAADRFVIMGTKQGVIKKTELSAYSNPRQGGIIALSLDAGDKLIGVDLTDGQREILLGTKQGITIRPGRRCAGYGTHSPWRARDYPWRRVMKSSAWRPSHPIPPRPFLPLPKAVTASALP